MERLEASILNRREHFSVQPPFISQFRDRIRVLAAKYEEITYQKTVKHFLYFVSQQVWQALPLTK